MLAYGMLSQMLLGVVCIYKIKIYKIPAPFKIF